MASGETNSADGTEYQLAYEPELLPPLALMRQEGVVVLEDWFRWAEEWSMLLRLYGRMTMTSRVLEIGCGLGRIAFPLRYLLLKGSYEGFEIGQDKVAYLEKVFRKAYPNFRFTWADVHNTYYHPNGRVQAKDYHFPYPDGSFDIVFAASVFTHMLPDAAANYFRQAARVLKTGGRCIFSFFLLDNYRAGQPRSLGFDKPIFNFDHAYESFGDEFATVVPDNPEQMTAYRLSLIENYAKQAGLVFARAPIPGFWSGQFENWISAQDVIVLVKQPDEDKVTGGDPSSETNEYADENAELRLRIERLQSDLSHVTAERNQYLLGWPPGHFYSPLPAIEEVRNREAVIFRVPDAIPAVDLNISGQFDLFEKLKVFYPDQPFHDEKQSGLRYSFRNPNFSYGEAIILYCLLRQLKPRRLIEIGSGYSSCVTIDTNERFLDSAVQCSFIEPHPETLLSLLNPGDMERIDLIRSNLQDIDIRLFSQLEADDILFIDSTHVSKVDSDVNHILFNILPYLNRGVYVHFHDIVYPFEYPKEWIYQGRAWNEAYILRAFLQFNRSFEIQFFNSFMGHFFYNTLAEHMPLCAKNPGTSIWLKKTA